MVNGVKGFGKIKENTHSIFVAIESFRYFVDIVYKCRFCRMELPKTILALVDYIELFEEGQ